MVSIYEGIINILNSIGFFNLFLPFILIYAISYGVLMKTKIFGDITDKSTRQLVALVSLAISCLTIGSFYVTQAIRDFVPLVALFMLIVFSFVMMLSIFFLGASDESSFGESLKKYRKILVPLAIISFILLVIYTFKLYIFIFNVFSGFKNINLPMDYIYALLMVILMIGIAYWITKPPKS